MDHSQRKPSLFVEIHLIRLDITDTIVEKNETGAKLNMITTHILLNCT